MIIELNREAEFRKQKKRFSNAVALFESFIKKYSRRKKLKKAHLTKNKTGKYMGEIIFIDMITSYPYTEEEKERIFQCIISMPPRSLYDFEQLYIKSSKSKLKSFMEEMEKHQEDSKELYTTNDIAYYLYNENKYLEDKTYYQKEKLEKKNKKYGKYTDIYKELDELYEQRNDNIRGFKKQAILSLIDKYHLTDNYSNLPNEEIENIKNRLYNIIKAGYKSYRDSLL